MRAIIVVAASALAIVAGACRYPDSPSEARTAMLPPGCFRLTLGTWSKAHEAVDPPTFVILETTLGTDGLESGKQLVREVPLPINRYPWSWWEQPPADSLRLVFTGGFVGVQVELIRGVTVWKGTASAFTDVAPSVQATASASFEPMTCPP